MLTDIKEPYLDFFWGAPTAFNTALVRSFKLSTLGVHHPSRIPFLLSCYSTTPEVPNMRCMYP